VLPDGTIFAFHKPAGSGDLTALGADGTNNYVELWQQRRVLRPLTQACSSTQPKKARHDTYENAAAEVSPLLVVTAQKQATEDGCTHRDNHNPSKITSLIVLSVLPESDVTESRYCKGPNGA
jgi:hypothetical protein